MKNLILAITIASLMGCNTAKKILNRGEDSVSGAPAHTWVIKPAPAVPVTLAGYETLSYAGKMPNPTFAKITDGGQPGSYVVVYVRVQSDAPWIEVPKSAGAQPGALVYAYDLGSAFGPIVRFLNTDTLPHSQITDPEGWVYWVYLVRPVQ